MILKTIYHNYSFDFFGFFLLVLAFKIFTSALVREVYWHFGSHHHNFVKIYNFESFMVIISIFGRKYHHEIPRILCFSLCHYFWIRSVRFSFLSRCKCFTKIIFKKYIFLWLNFYTQRYSNGTNFDFPTNFSCFAKCETNEFGFTNDILTASRENYYLCSEDRYVFTWITYFYYIFIILLFLIVIFFLFSCNYLFCNGWEWYHIFIYVILSILAAVFFAILATIIVKKKQQ